MSEIVLSKFCKEEIFFFFLSNATCGQTRDAMLLANLVRQPTDLSTTMKHETKSSANDLLLKPARDNTFIQYFPSKAPNFMTESVNLFYLFLNF